MVKSKKLTQGLGNTEKAPHKIMVGSNYGTGHQTKIRTHTHWNRWCLEEYQRKQIQLKNTHFFSKNNSATNPHQFRSEKAFF